MNGTENDTLLNLTTQEFLAQLSDPAVQNRVVAHIVGGNKNMSRSNTVTLMGAHPVMKRLDDISTPEEGGEADQTAVDKANALYDALSEAAHALICVPPEQKGLDEINRIGHLTTPTRTEVMTAINQLLPENQRPDWNDWRERPAEIMERIAEARKNAAATEPKKSA